MGTVLFKASASLANADAKVFGDTKIYLKNDSSNISKITLELDVYSDSAHITFPVAVTVQYSPTGPETSYEANERIEINRRIYINIANLTLGTYIQVAVSKCYNLSYFYAIGYNSSNNKVYNGYSVKLGLFDFFNLTTINCPYATKMLLEDIDDGTDGNTADLRNFQFSRITNIVADLNKNAYEGFFVPNQNLDALYNVQFTATVNIGVNSLNAKFQRLWLQEGIVGDVDINSCPNFKIKGAGTTSPATSCNLIMKMLYNIASPVIEGADVILDHVTDPALLTTAVINNVVAKFAAANGHFTLNGNNLV